MNVSGKVQTQGADSTNRKGSPVSLAASAGYSFSENLGVYAAYWGLNSRTVPEFYDKKSWGIASITGGIFNGNRYEGGLIYFYPINKEELFECSGGYSFGNIKRTSDVSPQRNFSIDYYSFFVQPSYGVKIDGFTFSGGMKFWYQRFNNFNASPSVQKDFYSGNDPITERPYFFVNPFMNFEFGVRFVKFNTQLGFPVHFRSSTNDPVIMGFPMYVNFGLTFRLEKDIFSDTRKTFKTKNEKS